MSLQSIVKISVEARTWPLRLRHARHQQSPKYSETTCSSRPRRQTHALSAMYTVKMAARRLQVYLALDERALMIGSGFYLPRPAQMAVKDGCSSSMASNPWKQIIDVAGTLYVDARMGAFSLLLLVNKRRQVCFGPYSPDWHMKRDLE